MYRVIFLGLLALAAGRVIERDIVDSPVVDLLENRVGGFGLGADILGDDSILLQRLGGGLTGRPIINSIIARRILQELQVRGIVEGPTALYVVKIICQRPILLILLKRGIVDLPVVVDLVTRGIDDSLIFDELLKIGATLGTPLAREYFGGMSRGNDIYQRYLLNVNAPLTGYGQTLNSNGGAYTGIVEPQWGLSTGLGYRRGLPLVY